jgi:hypothetical protein
MTQYNSFISLSHIMIVIIDTTLQADFQLRLISSLA